MATKNFTLNASADDAMEISGTVTLNGANGVVSAAARYAGFSFETAADPVAQGAVAAAQGIELRKDGYGLERLRAERGHMAGHRRVAAGERPGAHALGT